MHYVAQFELYRSDNGSGYIAEALGLGSSVARGSSKIDAIHAAHLLLAEFVDNALMRKEHLPDTVFVSSPCHGGEIIVLSVERDLDGIRAISAARAAEWLGVSRTRIGQLCDKGSLESWKEGARRMVSIRSVLARAEKQGKDLSARVSLGTR
ncbi:hypothetical protein [Paratractidigestivibacter sp.]|uniref:hypothetical protein n=1 Tax=Paratractidigestivibacter sp. TaxID=2847316 RepID=UPI002ABE3688|nr:hypothetical protein [Paratractidigestivibacter sp.]